MKSALLTAFAIAVLTVGNALAQRPYDNNRYNDRFDNRDRYDNRYDRDDAYNNRPRGDYRNQEPIERQLNRWSNELNLTRRQRRELDRIERQFAQRGLTPAEARYPDAYQRLQFEKRREMLSVLTPSQRDFFRDLERRNDYRPYRRG